ncbi:protein of unknown function [Halobacillus alkaliphilus]|uniref:DUF4362 domain-containing protein n=1 Tax=Halobacillus alkaliphilus TaxID=396056 RepID=A0A1I2PME4_9BACI|nr:DUF4362 domain-containing protein [Halobacillus alkaliphilus]SFG17405.1 protein of unknown function [Halobacillus alkaliphilus]
MKVWRVLLLALLLTGCAESTEEGTDRSKDQGNVTMDQEEDQEADNKEEKNAKDSADANKEEPEEKAVEKPVEIIEGLDAFIQNVQQGTVDEVHIVRRTTEGDPIFIDLIFNGEEINYKHDNRRDKLGNGQITTKTCQSIDKEEQGGTLAYQLTCGHERSVEVYQTAYNEY